ncbi:MAG: hypothetical protein KUL77_05150 [Thermomonas sp.]|uniref:hypothetical protein n=1 Tax=Thermomonas sp. TaxID=1971895 RepID=UPI001EC4FAF8|nr:hypothetical protein [Thermomonas sp.]MBV2208930.1 hypothetical protein [Thermomonas sp.]
MFTATIINGLLVLLPALLGVLIPVSLVLGLLFYVRHLNRKADSAPGLAHDPRSAATSTNDDDPYAPQNLPRPSDEVLARIQTGNILEAVRMYKLETNLGLLECKRVIQHYANH